MKAPVSDPYLAGLGLGLVLLSAYVLVGRGLGASGGFASVVAAGTAAIEGTTRASASPALAPYLVRGVASPLGDWLVLELAGGPPSADSVSAWVAGRLGEPSNADRRWTAAADAGSRRRRRVHGLRREARAGLHERAGADRGRPALRRQLDLHRDVFRVGYLFAPLARRLWR